MIKTIIASVLTLCLIGGEPVTTVSDIVSKQIAKVIKEKDPEFYEIQKIRESLEKDSRLSYPFKVTSRKYTYLRDLSSTILNAAKHTASDGTAIFYPDGVAAYAFMWTRDVAYMIQGRPDYFTADQIKGVFNYIASRVNTNTYEVPDHIGVDGTIYWTPGSSNNWGSRAPVDGNTFLVDIAWSHYKKTGSTSLYTDNKTLIKNLLNKGIPYNPTTGCVTISESSPFVGYGFMDTVKLTGDVLFPSVLAYRAYQQLADMAFAAEDYDTVTDALKSAISIQSGVQKTLWDGAIATTGVYAGPVGFFKAATGKSSHQDDLWGSAFAVWTGLASPEQSLAIAKNFESNYDYAPSSYNSEGGIRHVLKSQDYAPGVNVWESYFSPPAYGTYQNGGYWPTPVPWVAYSLSLVNPDLARDLIDDMITRFIADGANAPLEWWNGATIGVVKYAASATLPLLIMDREQHGIFSQSKNTASTAVTGLGSVDVSVTFDEAFPHKLLMVVPALLSTTNVRRTEFDIQVISLSLTGATIRIFNDNAANENGVIVTVNAMGY